MATKALETLYNWAKSTGYEKSIDDFHNLISTNKDALDSVYKYAKDTGYQNDLNAFTNLVGLKQSQETPTEKKSLYESDINRNLMPITENTIIREVEPEETEPGKVKKKYGKKQNVRIKEGNEERVISTDSSEYRKAYEEKSVMSLDEEGVPYQKSSEGVEVVGEKPDWLRQKEMIPGLDNIPNDIYYETIVKPLKTDIDALKNDTKSELMSIYTSKGYIDKLKNEIKKSGIKDKNVQDVITNRVIRLLTTPMEYDALEEGTRGEMTYSNKSNKLNSFYESPTDIKISSELKNEKLENKKSTAVEEYEHASHKIPKYKKGDYENITPYAKQINQKYNRSNVDYLKIPSEAISKKRATEVYLINKGLLSPGGFVDDSHYDYLLANYDKLPNNVKQFITITSGDEIDFDNLSNQAKLKLQEDKYNKNNQDKINVHTKDFNKKTQDFKKSFKAFMNEIAMNDRQQETKKIG